MLADHRRNRLWQLSILAGLILSVCGNIASAGVVQDRVFANGFESLQPPLDPADVAPPIDETIATTLCDASRFLYAGGAPSQFGANAGVFDCERIAVLRGQVSDRTGAPVSGVRISAKGNADYGFALSRADGAFDFVVNGGGVLTLDYTRDGLLPAQRQVKVPWQDYLTVDDVVLVELDPNVTTFDLTSSDMAVAQGSVIVDDDGTRQATLMCPPGTTASLVFPDGSTESISTLSIRATEYTVGDTGPEAMPGALPPTSGYTYAVELSADEAIAAGAADVEFSQSLPFYVENFLDFPVGTLVPSGYYDRALSAWVASENGLIVGIVGETDGLAELDLDGDGGANTEQDLAALGVTSQERANLAALYDTGQSLWRVPVEHFTPWDPNFPWGPPEDAESPDVEQPTTTQKLSDPCEGSGSIIECQNQVLGERVAVQGTALTLNYRSDRVFGRKDFRTTEIALSGASVPESLKAITLDLSIAGRKFKIARTSNLADQSYQFSWDGKDAYGRVVQGGSLLKGKISYVYEGVYTEPQDVDRAFARFGQNAIIGNRSRQEFALVQGVATLLDYFDFSGVGLGGWSLDVHHIYDPARQVLYLGSGQRLSARALGQTINRVAGTFQSPPVFEDGIDATEVAVSSNFDITSGPDGSLYFFGAMGQAAFDNAPRLVRVDSSGRAYAVAGNGRRCGSATQCGPASDGSIATDIRLAVPQDAAVGPDGEVYIADTGRSSFGVGEFGSHIRRVNPDGTIQVIAGTGEFCATGFGQTADCGDDGPALQARLSPMRIAVAEDGSLYVMERLRVRKITTDGWIFNYAGSGTQGTGGLGGLATQAQLSDPQDIALDPEGNLYIADSAHRAILKVDRDGTITRYAGNGQYGFSGDGGPATEAMFADVNGISFDGDGNLYVVGRTFGRVRQVDTAGFVRTVAGPIDAECPQDPICRSYSGDGGLALQAGLGGAGRVAAGPNGDLFVGAGVIRQISAPLPGQVTGEIVVGSGGGGVAYVFDPSGRHLRTVDALTGADQLTFAYDDQGRLSSIRDASANTTLIERDGAGAPSAILAPFGQRTELAVNSDGFLSSIENAAGERVQLQYTADGLLTQLTRPDDVVATYDYDDLGRLVRADDGNGYVTQLDRTELDNGGYEVLRTSGLGNQIRYRVDRTSGGETILTNTDAAGAEYQTRLRRDGTRTVSWPGGEAEAISTGPDFRFGIQTLGSEVFATTTPGGKTLVVESASEIELADDNDPFSVETISYTRTIGDRTLTSTYDTGTNAFIETSPMGRSTTTGYDAQGRISSFQLAAGFETRRWFYGASGQVSRVEQGPHAISYQYDASGRVVGRSDAAGRTQRYSYDAVGRVISMTTPQSRTFQFGYDAMGRVTSLTMPGGQTHDLDYAPFGGLVAYVPPGEDPMTQVYDDDRRRTEVGLADGRTQINSFDSARRSDGTSYSAASVSYSYHGSTNQFETITRTPVSGPVHSQSFEFDGDLLTGTTLELDAVSDSFQYTHDEDLRLAEIRLNDELLLGMEYNDDDQPIGYGPFVIERQGPAFSPSRYSDGVMEVDYALDSLGRLSRRTHTVDGTVLFDVQITHGAGSDLISQTVESVLGTQRVRDFAYSLDGEVLGVALDGIDVEEYAYDDNGNRTLSNGGIASYDNQDRLIAFDGTGYGFDSNGFLTTRGADTFSYTARGELQAATVAGQTVTYGYDAVGRQVARTSAGQTTQYLYGDPVDPFRLTATRGPDGTLTTYLYDQAGMLISLERSGDRFYVITDQVGSPRLIVNGAGSVVREMVYSAYGELVEDTGGFDLTIGFAGGIADSLTGLVRFGFRDYDPASGRWTSRDPILFRGGQFNLYAYANNNPVNLRDPSGLLCVGASAYAGPGAGAKLCFKDGKWSLCFEVGLGAGGGLALDFLGSTAPKSDADYVQAQASLGCGPAQVNVGIKLDNCGSPIVSGGYQFGAGGLGLGNKRQRNLLTGEVKDTNFGLGPPGTGASAQATLLEAGCLNSQNCGFSDFFGGKIGPDGDKDSESKLSCKAQLSITGGVCTGSDFF